MEKTGDGVGKPETMVMDGESSSMMSSNMFLDRVGDVLLTLNSNDLSWKLVENPIDNVSLDSQFKKNALKASSCLGLKFTSKIETVIKISDIYAVEYVNWGSIQGSLISNAGTFFQGCDSEMYRFTVHGFQRSTSKRSLWVLASYTFGHMDSRTCQTWVNQINSCVNKEFERPKSLLLAVAYPFPVSTINKEYKMMMVFVHPLSGKGNGSGTWDTVAPIFARAKVKTKVTVTQRAGQAFDVMTSITDNELNSYDGVVAVGGDGFFNEILNGLLSSRHKAPYPPSPTEIVNSAGAIGSASANAGDCNERTSEASDLNEDQDPLDQDPLLQNAGPSRPDLSNFRASSGSCDRDQGSSFPLPNERFRFGIIPSGSTDAIVICTTGTRDPVTSALQIVLGRKVCLDIAQVVRWKTTSSSKVSPYVRYAASFAGYGFYGDVIKESEKYRWMGPKRYDYAGTKVFLKHRAYDAEIAYVEVETKTVDPIPKKSRPDSGSQALWNSLVQAKKPERVICRMNCQICNEAIKSNHTLRNSTSSVTHASNLHTSKWLRSKGRFLSIGAAVISCRNDKAPDGLVADAHLADGFLHLILIKDCPHAFYLWHLTQLTTKGGTPLNFEFVEHFKTPAFTFTSSGDQSVWNLDGELLQAHQLSAQIFQGLITLFASGPEV